MTRVPYIKIPNIFSSNSSENLDIYQPDDPIGSSNYDRPSSGSSSLAEVSVNRTASYESEPSLAPSEAERWTNLRKRGVFARDRSVDITGAKVFPNQFGNGLRKGIVPTGNGAGSEGSSKKRVDKTGSVVPYVAVGVAILLFIFLYMRYKKNSEDAYEKEPEQLPAPRNLCGFKSYWSKDMKRRLHNFISQLKPKWSKQQVICAVNNLESQHSYDEVMLSIMNARLSGRNIDEFISLSQYCKPEVMAHQLKCSSADRLEYHNYNNIYDSLFQDDPAMLEDSNKRTFGISIIKRRVESLGGYIKFMEKLGYSQSTADGLKDEIVEFMNRI